jgi:hypothetical protein
MRHRYAKTDYLAEEDIVSNLLGQLSTINGSIADMVEFKRELKELQMEEDVHIDPMAEDLMGVYEELARKYQDARAFLIEELARISGAVEVEAEEEVEEEEVL